MTLRRSTSNLASTLFATLVAAGVVAGTATAADAGVVVKIDVEDEVNIKKSTPADACENLTSSEVQTLNMAFGRPSGDKGFWCTTNYLEPGPRGVIVNSIPDAVEHLTVEEARFEGGTMNQINPKLFEIEELETFRSVDVPLTGFPDTLASSENLDRFVVENGQLMQVPSELKPSNFSGDGLYTLKLPSNEITNIPDWIVDLEVSNLVFANNRIDSFVSDPTPLAGAQDVNILGNDFNTLSAEACDLKAEAVTFRTYSNPGSPLCP